MTLGYRPPDDVLMAHKAGSAAVTAHQGWIVAAFPSYPLVQLSTDVLYLGWPCKDLSGHPSCVGALDQSTNGETRENTTCHIGASNIGRNMSGGGVPGQPFNQSPKRVRALLVISSFDPHRLADISCKTAYLIRRDSPGLQSPPRPGRHTQHVDVQHSLAVGFSARTNALINRPSISATTASSEIPASSRKCLASSAR